jgi:cysteine synthase A
MALKIADSIIETVGNTPLVRLNRIAKDVGAEILVKCEFFNPLFSVKDRIGASMIKAAEDASVLKPGSVVIEPTSGNTGISLAFVCASRGYSCILTMPETMSLERRVLLRLLGAEIVLTPGPKGMTGAIEEAKRILERHGDRGFMPQQFENPANPEIHRQTTAEEIWEATGGDVDVLVSGVGTGGTITGVSEVIKSRRDLLTVAVEPVDSPVISGGKPGPHKIQGIGAGFIPANLNVDIVDDVVQVSNDDAFETARSVAVTDGLPVGISSGAAIWSAIQVGKRPEMRGKRIVVISASPSERYISTPLAEKIRDEVAALSAAS